MNYDFLNDLTLICADGQLQVISYVWCVASEVFSAMLANAMIEKASRQIKVEQFTMAIVSKIYSMLRQNLTHALVIEVNKDGQINATDVITIIRFCHLYQLKQLLQTFIGLLRLVPLSMDLIEFNRQLNLVSEEALLQKFFTENCLPIFSTVDIYYKLFKIAFDKQPFPNIAILISSGQTGLRKQPPIATPPVIPKMPAAPAAAESKRPAVPPNLALFFDIDKLVAKVTDSLINSTVLDFSPKTFYDITNQPIPAIIANRFILKIAPFNYKLSFDFFMEHQNTMIKFATNIVNVQDPSSELNNQCMKYNNEVTAHNNRKANNNGKRAKTDDE